MDNAAYEEFPKLATEDDGASETRDLETSDTAVIVEEGPCDSRPPEYTASFTASTMPGYPLDPPPAYTQGSMYPMPQFEPYNRFFDSSGLPPPIVVTEPPTDYLAPSIFSLIFCCLIFGMFGVIKSIATKTAVRVGDYELAYIHSLEARNWNIAAVVSGAIMWGLGIIALIVIFTV